MPPRRSITPAERETLRSELVHDIALADLNGEFLHRPRYQHRTGARIVSVRKVNLTEMFGRFQDQWSPKIVGEVNDSHVKLTKLKGEFVWHHHEREDELFLVVKGRLRMKLRDGDLVIEPGEFVIIPHGVEHLPVADEETHVLLFEPNTTLNTGNIENERTVPELERL